jgi:hypothetical protein
VALFDENMKFYFTLGKKCLTLSLDLDPDPELDPDPHKITCGSETLVLTLKSLPNFVESKVRNPGLQRPNKKRNDSCYQ